MFSVRSLLAASALSVMAAPCAWAGDYAAEKAQILTIEKTMAAAQSMAQLAPYFDPNIVFDDQLPNRVVGIEAVAPDISAQFARVKNLHDTILKMDIDADDHLAFAYSIQHLTLSTAANQPFAETFRQTDCYHRVGGKWLMVYQHVSVPFDVKTGKAVFDEVP